MCGFSEKEELYGIGSTRQPSTGRRGGDRARARLRRNSRSGRLLLLVLEAWRCGLGTFEKRSPLRGCAQPFAKWRPPPAWARPSRFDARVRLRPPIVLAARRSLTPARSTTLSSQPSTCASACGCRVESRRTRWAGWTSAGAAYGAPPLPRNSYAAPACESRCARAALWLPACAPSLHIAAAPCLSLTLRPRCVRAGAVGSAKQVLRCLNVPHIINEPTAAIGSGHDTQSSVERIVSSCAHLGVSTFRRVAPHD